MLPPWPMPLRHSHSCLYTGSVFERKKLNCETGWGYQKILLENVLLEKAFSDSVRSGFLVPYQKSRFLITFSNSIRSDLKLY